jgi:hypothetical protein
MSRFGVVLFFVAVYALPLLAEEEKSPSSKASEFPPLEDPDRNISGAYWGAGVALSRMSSEVKITETEEKFKKSDNQFDVSAIAGFGSPFDRKYYIGLEVELFKRSGGKVDYRGCDTGVTSVPTVGINMDLRFGYLFRKEGVLLYLTTGFGRIIGKVFFREKTDNPKKNNEISGSFGSFYPVFGLGVEYKMNHLWNVRGDFRAALTSKDDNDKRPGSDKLKKYEGKPGRIAFRLSFTRSI